MNVFDLLKRDHSELRSLLDQIGQERSSTPEEQLEEIRCALELHASLEERFVYPLLWLNDATKDVALEAMDDHAVMKRLLHELSARNWQEEDWLGCLRLLRDRVEAHCADEEAVLFELARKSLTTKKAEDLGTLLEQVRASAVVRGVRR
jgi:hypothetical protein